MTLGAVRAATIVCPDLETAVELYSTCLGYRRIELGVVAPALAEAWGAPAVEGARAAVLAPASGADTYIRFVEVRGTAPYAPCSAWGWHALELTVQDCDAATEQVSRGPFRVLGEPRELSFSDGALRAAQLLGPYGEVLYLTQVCRAVPGYELPSARSLIDRVFIAVQHGPDAAAGLAWYARTFGNVASETMAVPIEFMAALHGLDPAHPYAIGTLALAPGFYFELDDTPAHIGMRPRPPGGLPPGIAMVSCLTDRPAAAEDRTPAGSAAGAIYDGISTVSRGDGPGGEWLEYLHVARSASR